MENYPLEHHWGESPELNHQKHEIKNVYLYMPPDKKSKIESIEPLEEEETEQE